MSWEKVKLGDIADFSNGINFGKDYYGKGIKLIGVSNFGDRFFPEYESLDEVKEEVVRKNDFLKSGDIVFVRSNGNKALVGRCMLIDCPVAPVTYSGFCIRARLKDTTKHYPPFWTYHFKNISFRRVMSGTAVGTNIQNLSQGRLSTYEAIVPDFHSQLRIADILSDYDTLIENNQKQIKLLEEAARRLYKEWFVDFHFPGYEDVKIVDGLPEGWVKKPIYNVFKIKYGKILPKTMISYNGKYPVYGANGIIGYYQEKNVEDYVVLITSRGNGSGDILRTHDKEAFITNNSFIVKAIDNNLGLSFIYHLMKNTDFKKICTGSAQPQLTNSSIGTIFLTMPNIELIKIFSNMVDVWFEKIECLIKENRILEEARDRLLPKLMSGNIEV